MPFDVAQDEGGSECPPTTGRSVTRSKRHWWRMKRPWGLGGILYERTALANAVIVSKEV